MTAGRVQAPVDVVTRVRFRSVLRDVDEHDGRPWQLRVELDLHDSPHVEIAEELLTSDRLDAQVVTGKGSLVRMTIEQAAWLRHKLEVLLTRFETREALAVPANILSVDSSWLTSREAAMRLGIGSNEFWVRVRRLDAVPVHRNGRVSYWNRDQIRMLDGGARPTTGNREPSGSVR